MSEMQAQQQVYVKNMEQPIMSNNENTMHHHHYENIVKMEHQNPQQGARTATKRPHYNAKANHSQNAMPATHHLNATTTISAVKPSMNNKPIENSFAMISKYSPSSNRGAQQPPHMNHTMVAHPYQQQSPNAAHHHKQQQQPQQHPQAMGHYQRGVNQNDALHHRDYAFQREKINMEMQQQPAMSTSHSQHNGREHMMQPNPFANHHIDVKNEFKTPEKMRYDRNNPSISIDEHNMNRAFIAENMNVYNPSSRPSSTSSASSNGPHNFNRQMMVAASPSPSPSNLPDYTQVSPAKMALRRHLSQEKISHYGNGPISSKTIGDLVNGEIERTLEISHQSIINAAIDMSSMGNSSASSVINDRIQRPERVNVRIMDDLMPPQHQPFGFARNREVVKSPVHLHGQSNLATLAHVANNHKQITQQFSPQHMSHGKPLTVQTASPSQSAQYSPKSQPAKYMPLPRADMKPNWEHYFNESNAARPADSPQQHKHSMKNAGEEHRSQGPQFEGDARFFSFR